MLLPAKELKGFIYHKLETSQQSDKNYNQICVDTFTLFYEKKFGIFNKTKIVTFNRFTNANERWEMTKGAKEFSDQLKAINAGKWTQIPTEMFNKIKEEHPEFLL